MKKRKISGWQIFAWILGLIAVALLLWGIIRILIS